MSLLEAMEILRAFISAVKLGSREWNLLYSHEFEALEKVLSAAENEF